MAFLLGGRMNYIIINKDNITDIDFKELIVHMNNGETCPVSVRKKKGLKKLMA